VVLFIHACALKKTTPTKGPDKNQEDSKSNAPGDSSLLPGASVDADRKNIFLNMPPLAYAGNDQVVKRASLVVLDGSRSYQPNTNSFKLMWEQISGPVSLTLINSTTLITRFIAPTVSGVFSFKLTVTDKKSPIYTSDTVTIRVSQDKNDFFNVSSAYLLTPPFLSSISRSKSQSDIPSSFLKTYAVKMNISPNTSLVWQQISGSELIFRTTDYADYSELEITALPQPGDYTLSVHAPNLPQVKKEYVYIHVFSDDQPLANEYLPKISTPDRSELLYKQILSPSQSAVLPSFSVSGAWQQIQGDHVILNLSNTEVSFVAPKKSQKLVFMFTPKAENIAMLPKILEVFVSYPYKEAGAPTLESNFSLITTEPDIYAYSGQRVCLKASLNPIINSVINDCQWIQTQGALLQTFDDKSIIQKELCFDAPMVEKNTDFGFIFIANTTDGFSAEETSIVHVISK